jgi:hypothetical protein
LALVNPNAPLSTQFCIEGIFKKQLPKYQFTSIFYDHEVLKKADFNCQEEEPLDSGFCIFHDKDYLQDMTNYEEHKRKVLYRYYIDRLKHIVNHATSDDKPLLCIRLQHPYFSLSDLSVSRNYYTYIPLWLIVLWEIRFL